jgi:hypothetical protein
MSVAAFEPDGADAPKVPGAHIVCTLAEGHYFHGVAALTNSLVRAGFKGTLVVGYRGARPHWLDTLKLAAESDSYLVAPQVRLQLLEVGGAWHLNNCKPEFIRQMLFERYPHAELVYYFDTDIVIKCAWEALAAWAACGVLTVLDAVDSYMSPHHVYRNAWRGTAGAYVPRFYRVCQRWLRRH